MSGSKPLGVSMDDAVYTIEWMARIEEERAATKHQEAASSNSDFTADDLSCEGDRHKELAAYLRTFKDCLSAA